MVIEGLAFLVVLLTGPHGTYRDDLLQTGLPEDGHGGLVLIQRDEHYPGFHRVPGGRLQPVHLGLFPVLLADTQRLPRLYHQGVVLPDILRTLLYDSEETHAEPVAVVLDLLDTDAEGHPLLLGPLCAELVVRLLVAAGGGGGHQVADADDVV